MKVRAQLKNYRMSPRKVRVVSDTVKGISPDDAVARLKACTREAAGVLKTLIEAAVANAQNNFQLEKDSLFIKDIIVDESTRLKRWRPRSHGRAARIIKRTSHITVFLEEKQKVSSEKEESLKKVVQSIEKKSEKKEVKKNLLISEGKNKKEENKTSSKKEKDLTKVEKKGKKVSKLEK